MKTKLVYGIIAAVVASIGTGLSPFPSLADTCVLETQKTSQSVGPGVTEYGYTTTATEYADSRPVVIEKPVVLENTTKTVEREVVRERVPYFVTRHSASHARRSVAYLHHNTMKVSKPSRNYSSVTTIEKTIEKPIVVERPVIQNVDRVVEKPVYINRVVEKPVYVDRMIDRPVFIDRTVSRPVVIERRVDVTNPLLVPRRLIRVDEF